MAKTIIVKPLGLVLQKAGLVTTKQVETALKDLEFLSNSRIGEIMVRRGWITQQTADFFAEKWPQLTYIQSKQPLGQHLKAAGLINDSQINIILQEQITSGLKFGASAVLKGIISQATLDFFLEQLNLIKDNKSQPNQKSKALTEVQINRLSQIENYLIYNRTCEPTILINLYRQIWLQGEIAATGSQAEQELLQSGLVIQDNDRIKRSSLERHIFNDCWIENQLVRLQPYSKIRLKLSGLEMQASLPYKVLAEITAWTNGQPFLTQKIYQIIRQHKSFIPRNQEAKQVAELVHQYVIDRWETSIAAPHLLRLRSQFLTFSLGIKSLLLSYQEIWHTHQVPFNRSPEQEHLLDIGLIKLEQGQVEIANRIYHHIFDHIWLEEQMAKVNNSISTSLEHKFLNCSPEQVLPADNQHNFSQLTKTIIVASLILVGSWVGLGFNLVVKYLQLQQLKQANQLLTTKNYQSAIVAYDKLLQTNIGQREHLWHNRGYAWSRLQNYNEMLQSCSAATIVNTQSDLGWNCRGEALYHLGQYEAALQAFEQASAINPREPNYLLNKSRTFFKLQHYDRAFLASEQAIKFLEQESEVKPVKPHRNLAIAFNQKGQSLLRTGQLQQAIAAFDQSIKNSADYLSARQGKAISLYKLGHYNQAVAAFDRILQRHDLTNNQEATMWLYKGICLCDAEKSTEADLAFKQVLELSTNSQHHKLAQAGCGIR